MQHQVQQQQSCMIAVALNLVEVLL